MATSLEKRRLREQQKELIQRLSAAAAAPGTAATAPATEAQRAAVTVLAVRLRDGASVQELAPSEAIALLDDCHTLWRDAIASHGGVALEGGGEDRLTRKTPPRAPVLIGDSRRQSFRVPHRMDRRQAWGWPSRASWLTIASQEEQPR